MVVNDFYVLRARRGPAETDAVLIVDSNTVLTLSIPLQSLQPIAGRDLKVSKRVALV